MFGGPRCFLHNPTPEQRDSYSSVHHTQTTTILGKVLDSADDFLTELIGDEDEITNVSSRSASTDAIVLDSVRSLPEL